MANIEELRAQLAQAEKEARELGQREYEAVRKAATFEWRMLPTPHGFHVECRYDEVSRERVAAWKAAFPNHGTINFREPDKWHGMTYVFAYTKDGHGLLVGGGGSVILRTPSFGDPIPLTAEETTSFEAGIVPDSLKKPW